MVTVVPFSRETVTLVKSPFINPCDCLSTHAGTGVVEFVPADDNEDYDDTIDRCMISIGEEEEYFDYEYDCEYESDLQEVASADIDGDAQEITCRGTGNGWTPAKATTVVTAPTDSRFLMRDLIYDHHDCDASAGQRNFATQSHPPTMNKIETLNLVTVNANTVASHAAAAASRREILARDTLKVTATSAPAASNADSDDPMCHQHQSSVDITDTITETLCTEPAHAPTERCLFVPAVFRRREPSTTLHPRSHCTTPVHRRRSPLVEVTIDADVCGDRKETVIAGWVYCEEERAINTDLSCEDSECDHGCHCFGAPHVANHHDHEHDCEDRNSSAVIHQFMFKKRSSPPLDDIDLRFYKEEAQNRATCIDPSAGKSHHLHVIHQYDDDNDDDAYDRCYTETESETSYEGDDEVSIPELLSGIC